MSIQCDISGLLDGIDRGSIHPITPHHTQTQLDVTGDRPFIMGPLATVAAVMRVSDPANGDPSPDIMTLWCVLA